MNLQFSELSSDLASIWEVNGYLNLQLVEQKLEIRRSCDF